MRISMKNERNWFRWRRKAAIKTQDVLAVYRFDREQIKYRMEQRTLQVRVGTTRARRQVASYTTPFGILIRIRLECHLRVIVLVWQVTRQWRETRTRTYGFSFAEDQQLRTIQSRGGHRVAWQSDFWPFLNAFIRLRIRHEAEIADFIYSYSYSYSYEQVYIRILYSYSYVYDTISILAKSCDDSQTLATVNGVRPKRRWKRLFKNFFQFRYQ